MTPLETLVASPYSTMYTLCIAVAALVAYRQGRDRGWDRPAWIVAICAWTVGGIVGSAAVAALANGEPGGKTMVGAVAGSSLALVIAARCVGIRPASALDAVALAIPAGGILVRVGCFFAGCCAGIPTTLPWGVSYAPGSTAFAEQVSLGWVRPDALVSTPVHPVQLYDAIACAILGVLLQVFRNRLKRRGDSALAMVAGLAMARFILQFLRENHVGARGLDVTQWAMLAVMATIVIHLATRGEEHHGPVCRSDAELGYLVVLGASVGVSAYAAAPWLSPLDVTIALAATGVSLAAVIYRLRAEMPAPAPIGALAALALQQASPNPASLHRYFEIGLGRSQSSYLFHGFEQGTVPPESCDAPPTLLDYDRKHTLILNSLSASVRVDSTPGTGIGFRGQLFQGEDQMGGAIVRVGTARNAEPHSESIVGGGGALDVDRRHVGFTIGLGMGSWQSVSEESPDGNSGTVAGIFGVRVGALQRLYVEAHVKTLGSAAIELPGAQFGLVVLNTRGDKFRFGASDSGPYGEGSIAVTDCVHLSALFSRGDDTQAVRFMVQQRFDWPKR